MGASCTTCHAHTALPPPVPGIVGPLDGSCSCGDDWLCSDPRTVQADQVPANFALANLMDEMQAGSLDCRSVNFPAMDVVPPGWKIIQDEVPVGFGALGGTACVIGEAGGNAENLPLHVLLALPFWAVDKDAAERLMALTQSADSKLKVCRLWRCTVVRTFNTTVFEFDFPQGQPLSRLLEKKGCIEEDIARDLCRNLLQLIDDLANINLCFWGFVCASMTYVDHLSALSTLLPVSCLLTFKGAKCIAQGMSEPGNMMCVTPEMSRALCSTDLSLALDLDVRFATDNYAVAALILRALTKAGPEFVMKVEVAEALPEPAADLLQKVLYRDHQWRLKGSKALEHRWLRPIVQHAV